MKTLGALLICFSLGMRIEQYLETSGFDYALLLYGVGILLIIKDEFLSKKGVPKMQNPPSPPKKCICNDIGKHSPGGRCEVCYSKKKDGGSTFKI